MWVLVDSSSLYSALLHDGTVAEVVEELLVAEDVVVTDYIVEEIRRNLEEALGPEDGVDPYLEPLLETVGVMEAEEYRHHLSRVPQDVSRKDTPVVAAALRSEVDVLLTSDHELLGLDLPGTEVVSPMAWREEG